MTVRPVRPGADSLGGGVVASVQPDSPAARAGLEAGERIRAADGHVLADILDWQWATSDADDLVLAVVGENGESRDLMLARRPGEAWGIGFRDALFDGVRLCDNDCTFCFVAQLPHGLRRSLFVRDDDYRLSFLDGTFITLTNLTDMDVRRISEQRLSPLYISLHAITPAVRAQLVCAAHDRALERFDALAAADIDMHVQIVLVPGVNEGEELERTLAWLAERPAARSVGVVPVGYTSHQQRIRSSFGSPADAAAVLAQLFPWQSRARAERSETWVQAADELYLAAKAPIPPAEAYDGFPQIENGIGLVRTFLDDVEAERPRLAAAARAAASASPLPLVLLTGELFATVLAKTLGSLGATSAVVLPVPNRFFGGNVSVTGLLSAEDIASAVREHGAPARYVLPDIVLNTDGLTVDDATVADLAEAAGAPVHLVSSDAAGLLQALRLHGSTHESSR